MSFISDLLVEISSFRIRIGNKLNALKTLIDGKANIDGSNIPAGTFWNTLKAGGVGNYIYVDAQENDFTRVMVWENGGWFWTNKSGMQTWLGLDDLPIWNFSLAVNTNNRRPLRYADSTDFTSAADQNLYEIHLVTKGTGTITGAKYVLRSNGTTWQLILIRASGTSSNHPKMEIDSNGVPLIFTEHNSSYSVVAEVRRYRTGLGSSSTVNHITYLGLDYESILNK